MSSKRVNRHLTVNEATVLKQVIDDIRTGKYKPEQYSSLFEERIKQHPSLKKNSIVVRDRQIKKLLEELQIYLATHNNFEEEENDEPPAQSDQKVAEKKERYSNIDKNLQQNISNKSTPSIVDNLNVNEATVLNQVIEEIRTGKYKPEQYNDLFEKRFKQHPVLKKTGITRRNTQINKLLDALSNIDKNLQQNISNKSTPSIVDNLNVNEATVLNQVIEEIKTGKYKAEQYNDLFEKRFKQHPVLKKTGITRRNTQINKLLDALQASLVTENNSEKRNGEHPAEDEPQQHFKDAKKTNNLMSNFTEETSLVKTRRDFHKAAESAAQTRRAAGDASINKPRDSEDQTEFELRSRIALDAREIQVKLPKLSAKILRKFKSLLVEVVESVAKENTGSEKLSKLEKVKSRNGRKSVIVDSEDVHENKGCGTSKRYEKTTKTTQNIDIDCESGEEYENIVNDIPEDREEITSSKVIDRTKSVESFDTQSFFCGKENNGKSEKLSDDESDFSDENIKDISKTESSSSEALDAYESEVVSIGDSSIEDEEDEENGDYMSYSDVMIDLTHNEDSSSDSESTSLKEEAGQNIQLSQESLFTDESLQLEENQETWQNVSLLQNMSLDALAISPPIQRRTLILQENIKIDGSNNTALSQRINNFVQFFGSTVPKGKFSLKLSLEQKDSQNPPQEENEGNSEAVNSDTEESKSQEDEISSPQLNGKVEDESVSQIGNSVSTFADDELERKRCLNRSLSEILTENKKTKRLKVQIEPLDANYLKNRQIITPSSSIGEDMWKVSPISSLKPSTSSSTRVKPCHV